jgi:CxxC motif-containing protein (DUF1111 family)
MLRPPRKAIRLLAWILTLGAGLSTRQATAQFPGDPIAGRELFERVWEAGSEKSGPLGPLYNERSCVACHQTGAIGGGGLNSRNVTLVSVEIPDSIRLPADPREAKDPPFTKRREALNHIVNLVRPLHFGLNSGSIVLHAYGVDPRYAVIREQLLGLRPIDTELPNPGTKDAARGGVGPIRRIEHRGVTLLVTARNSPAMFGDGLIDRLSVADIKAAADDQAERHPAMAGRFAGRFGWRGQTLDLRSFVAGACSVELGLAVRNTPATASPVATTLSARHKTRVETGSIRTSNEPELDDRQFNNLVAFVASLPAPGRRKTADEADAELVRRGEEVFESTDCAVCHRTSIGNLTGIYSDLLLHDMGPELYDPQPAPASDSGRPRDSFRERPRSAYQPADSQSFGEFVGNRPYEWRTPPLWGVAHSGPYLHDGRALTLDDAIRMHGGQAEPSARRYRELPEADRRAMMKFLMSLIAPDSPELKAPLSRPTPPDLLSTSR